MICCLVSNETTNLACFTVNTILFVCLPFIVLFSLFERLMEKESLPRFCPQMTSPPHQTFLCCICSYESRCCPTQYKVKHEA